MTNPTGQTYVGHGQGHLTMSIGELHRLAKHGVMDKVDELVQALDTIAKTLECLEISWAGDAKNEAQQLLDRWSEVSSGIFGTKENPEKGVLARIAGGVQNAAFSYNQSEAIVQTSWNQLAGEFKTILAGGTPASGGDASGNLTPPISEV
ncbi:WXG100 family type VII secretion target [Actinoplanes solisilvae]|uniref:WXG100 family type VII secretion target n=1 Tax=Actinoplanes solisilvae TaxID=2486853 RepID=UPI000FD6CC84|nr:hypothetical protein [Actinoplanes solisilvae]